MRLDEEGAPETSVTNYGTTFCRNSKIAEPELIICIVAGTEFNFHHKILPAQAADLHRYRIRRVA